MDKNLSIAEAMQVICKAIREDEGYRMGWVANIAMAFKDEYGRNVTYNNDGQYQTIHAIANKAANNFLDLLTRRDVNTWNQSESIFAFMAWLTTREESLTVGAKHDAAPIPPLIGAFMNRHKLPEVREDYQKQIVSVD